MKQPRLAVFLIALSLVSACGGSKSAAPGSSASASDFCKSYTQAAAVLMSQCFGGEKASWEALYAPIFDCSRLATDVAAGVLSYDAQKGAQCLELISKVGCDQMEGDYSVCDAAVVGHIASGGTCTSALKIAPYTDCAPGNHCDLDITTCGGTCKPYAQAGASCASTSANGSVECADGSECQINTDVCVADVGEGQPCQGPTAGYCGDGLYCENGSTTTAGMCRKKKSAGACADAMECLSYYRCVGAEGSKTCRKSKLLGESCTPGLGECFILYSWCGSDGKCTNVPAKDGQPCGSSGGDYIRCEDGLTCVLTSGSSAGTCQKKGNKPAGSPCTDSTECGGTVSYCNPTTKQCVGCD
jgi:hypothetical protein